MRGRPAVMSVTTIRIYLRIDAADEGPKGQRHRGEKWTAISTGPVSAESSRRSVEYCHDVRTSPRSRFLVPRGGALWISDEDAARRFRSRGQGVRCRRPLGVILHLP